MTKHDNERLKRLEKRLNWLNTRLYQAGDKDLTFDKAEASALEWGIDIIERYLKVKVEQPEGCKHIWCQLNKPTPPPGAGMSYYEFYCQRCLTTQTLTKVDMRKLKGGE